MARKDEGPPKRGLRASSVGVKCVRSEADCIGSARREHVELVLVGRRSVARLRLGGVGSTGPSESVSNEALYVERWKAVGKLLCGLALIADELEDLAISLFHGGHGTR